MLPKHDHPQHSPPKIEPMMSLPSSCWPTATTAATATTAITACQESLHNVPLMLLLLLQGRARFDACYVCDTRTIWMMLCKAMFMHDSLTPRLLSKHASQTRLQNL